MERSQRKSKEDAAISDDVNEFIASFPALIVQARSQHQDDKLFLAYWVVKQLNSSLQHHLAAAQGGAYPPEVLEQLKAIEAEMETNREQHQRIATEKKEVRALMRELRNEDGWTLVGEHEGGNVQVFYRGEKSTPVHSIKMQGVVDSPALNLMAIMNEHALYDSWIPLLKEVRLVKQISRYRKVMYLSAHLPWPISSRDVLLYGYGVDNLEEDRAVIMIRSAGEGDIEPHLIPPVKSHVRADVQFTGVMIQPISENQTRLVMMTNVDPKLAYMPYTLLNWATKVLSYQMWSTMAKHAQEIEGSKYEELIAENEVFYADIKAKLSSLSFGARDDNEEADNVEHEQQQQRHSSSSREDSSGSVEEGDEDSEEETHQQGGGQEEDSNKKTKKKKKGGRLRTRLSLRKHKHDASPAVAQ